MTFMIAFPASAPQSGAPQRAPALAPPDDNQQWIPSLVGDIGARRKSGRRPVRGTAPAWSPDGTGNAAA